ncbi:hypothetical protein SK128_004014 [Halocaridina rubra]|uniref:Uncharacterized protein n=1 Tax=Halocaridina rubra TaxID=373956 RepID=A0AAN8ZUI2_HALRR
MPQNSDPSVQEFKCEKDGSFIDEMNPVGVIESVRELLNQMDAANVKLYLETRQVDQATASLSSVLKAVKNNLCAAVKRNYDESVTAAVISFVEENIALIGERAALNMTHTLATSLKERAETAARARDTLMAKYAKMTSFDKEVNSRLEDIYELAAYVTESQDSINNLIDKVKLDVNATLESTSLPTPYSEDSFSTESKILADLPLSYLLTANIDGNEIKQKAFMTTNSLVWYDRNIAEAGYSALASLGLGHLCWDEVYNVIVTRMNDITCLKNQMKRLSNLKAAVSSAEKKTKVLSKQEVKELTDTALKSDAKLERAITKLVDSNEKRITEGHHQLDRLRRVLNEWWEQPAKKVVIRELE